MEHIIRKLVPIKWMLHDGQTPRISFKKIDNIFFQPVLSQSIVDLSNDDQWDSSMVDGLISEIDNYVFLLLFNTPEISRRLIWTTSFRHRFSFPPMVNLSHSERPYIFLSIMFIPFVDSSQFEALLFFYIKNKLVSFLCGFFVRAMGLIGLYVNKYVWLWR